MVGDLDRRIELGTFTRSRNLSGEDVRTWSYSSPIWAQVKTVSGSENFQGDQKVGHQTIEVIIRFRSNIAQTGRIIFESKTYEIESITEIDRKRYYKIIAKKQDNE